MKYRYIFILLLLISSTFTGCSTIQKIAEFNLDHLNVEEEVTERDYEKLPESTYIKDTIELSMDNAKTLNPLDGVAYNVDQGLKLVYESLFSPDEYKHIEPLLVSEYEQINERTYRLTLKDQVTFHNGEPLTAEDVVFSYEYINTQANSGYSYVNTYIQNLTAEAENTVVVEFQQKDRYNLYALTFPILSQAYLESDNYDKTFPIGTGPYQCNHFQSMIELVLNKNPNYHGQTANVDKVRFTLVRSFAEEYNMFMAKRIDLIAPVLTEWPNYSDDQNIQKKQYLSPYFYYIGFNHTNVFYQDVNVRRYYSSLIDYSHINRTAFLNHLFFTPLPMHLESEIQGRLKQYDVFDQSNTKVTSIINTEAIRFIYLSEDHTQENIIKIIQASIDDERDNIEFIGLSREEYYQALIDGSFDMYLNTFQASLIPSLNQVLASNGRYNYGKYSNQNIDGLLASYRQVETDEQYINQLNTLSQWVMDEFPIIPIGFLENGMFIHNKIEGAIGPNYFHVYKNIQDIEITDYTDY
jgi:peptide/nickel transport system substrate-binding protein